MNRRTVVFSCLIIGLISSPSARGQGPCPNLNHTQGPFVTDNHLICTLPQLYGPQGITVEGGAAPLSGTTLHTTLGFTLPFKQLIPAENNFLLSVNQTIAREVGVLPLVTPASVVSLVFDRSLGVFIPDDTSFGPIFSERASTIGRHRLAFGFSYQYMNFDTLDGVDIHSFPTLFVEGTDFVGHPCNPLATPPTCVGSTHDFITATNRIDLKLNQYTAFAAFGLTKYIDVSLAVPVLSISMRASADSTIVHNSGNSSFTSFETPANLAGRECLATPSQGLCASEALFFNSQRALGIGDVTVRVKATVKAWERSGLAAGIDIRVPTGDEKNFLGTGASGIRPFAVWSRKGRISPHVNLGYEWNGQSILAGDVTTGTKENIPSQLLYSGGLEVALLKRLTAAADLVGQTVFNANRVHLVQAQAPGLCNTFFACDMPGPAVQVTAIEGYKGTYASNDASLGVRYRPFGRFLLSGNVLLKLDESGLRAKAIPTASATYTF